jgi:Transcriptional regulatory protein, C terminal
MAITVGLLGVFTLAGPGGTIEPSGRRQRSLAAILALEGGRIVSAARLIELLWPDTEPVDPLNALHHQVSRLRSAIGSAGDRARGGQGRDASRPPDRRRAGRVGLRWAPVGTGGQSLSIGRSGSSR